MENQINNQSELEKLRNEITAKLNERQHKTLSWNSITVTVILGALALVSVAQMAASVNIYNKLKTGDVKASTGVPQNNSLQNQPDMVGGC